MKKTLSLVMVVAMLLSACAFAIPASAAATAVNIEYYNALQFTTPPTIDGYISVEEWGDDGDNSIVVWASDCATVDDRTPYSRFFYNRVNATDRSEYGSFEYQVWFRYDLNNFYIGVKVTDPDIHSLKYGTTDAWNGDAVQIRVDKDGANAASYGADFVWTSDVQKPWSSAQVPDMIFGYVEIAGGFSEAWENTANKGMTSFSKNPLGVAQCVVAPAGSSYSTDTQSGITTYEVAVPWAYIFNGELTALLPVNYRPGRGDAAKGAYGRELGVSVAVLNDGNDNIAGYDAFMAWGSGICGAHQEQGSASVTGSNAVTLVEQAVNQVAGYKTYNPSSLLDAKFSQENIDAPNVFYDYLGGDINKANKVSYDKLTTITYDNGGNDLTLWGAPEYGGTIGNLGGDHGNVLDYTKADEDNVQTYIDTRDGDFEYLYPTSYTFEFDIMYTGTNSFADGYEPALYNWFGGAGGYSYQCGYFFNDNMFKIVNSNDPLDVLAKFSYDFKKDNWYNWKFQFDNESCTARLWIDDLSTEADNKESGTAGTPGYTGEWGTLVFNTSWRYFYYSAERALEEGTLLLFRQMNTQVAYDNVKIYNFASVTDVYVPDENKTPGGSANIEQSGGSNLGTDNAQKQDGVWTIPVNVAKEYLSATKLSFTVKFDSTKAKFAGVDGLNEGTYTAEEVAPGEYLITITDFAQVKALKAGDKFFDIKLESDVEDIADLGLDLTDAYTYRNTGDGMMFILIAVAVSVLGCAIIIRKRRSVQG